MSQETKKFNEKTVTRIAQNVTAGTISKHWLRGRSLQYICIYVATGAVAPTEKQILDNGFDLFPETNEQAFIDSSSAIDVYVYANLEDGRDDKGFLVVSA
jgi:hypothetical protein